jgi:RNA polymerase sigma factor (sigma-70 family)
MRTEDGYIINKCFNGEPEAFGFLVDKYRSSIFAFAYSRLRNFHDAEDIAQEVFIKAYRKLGSLKRWDNFRAWLYSITSNLCKDFIRSQESRPDGEFVEDIEQEILDSPSMDFYQEGLLRESLHEVLDSLPAIYREVLTLHYLGGMSTFEIAQFLGTSPDTIRQRLSRARAKLKEEMIAMMSTTFDQKKLQPGFTFRIVEMVKQIKIQSTPRAPWLPWGLSAATGIVLTVLMSFSPYLISLTPLGALLGSPIPSKTKVMEVGELPVDVLEISEISFLSSEQGDGKASAPKRPKPQNAFAPPLAPSGGEGKWTKRADMPTGRCYFSTSVVGGKIYAIGGFDRNWNFVSTVEEYDPVTDKWTKKADMPTARSSFSTCAVNGKIYAIGGWRDGAPIEFSTVEEYDPVTDKWTKKADMPTGRQYFSTSAVGGKIYAIGGWRNGVALSTVEEYDAVKDKWTKKADMPATRMWLSTSAVNGKIYAIGGCPTMDGVSLSTVEEYDAVADKWTKKADMPTARSNLSTCAVSGKIYAIGGQIVGGVSISTVEEYDAVKDKWTKVLDMPTARCDLSANAVNGKIYAIGGWSRGLDWQAFLLSTVVEEYTPEGSAVSPQGKLPTMWGRLKRGN